jgi:alpha-tubulin suppressor-like RCC1 family protein
LSEARRAAAGALATIAALTATLGGCLGPGDFHCTDHAQCALGTTPGYCEPNGHCSIADDRCQPSERRYVHSAGDDADSCVPEPCGADPMKAVQAVSAGGGHACLLRADGSLWCWGRNDRGQLGDGTRTPRPLPVRVAALVDPARAVATGDAHTCASTETGKVFCWGAGDLGQLGADDRGDHGLPQLVLGVANVSALAAGSDFSCALGDDDGVRCWGDDSVGQLGDGGGAGSPAPVAVTGLGAGIQTLVAQAQHACALTTLGLLTCWGANSDGQIGDGTIAAARVPTLVNDPSATPTRLPAFSSVAVGGAHTCAVATEGLYCWGANAQGQVSGTNPGASLPRPTPVPGMDAIDPVEVTAGAQHTCVLSAGASVGCWGSNSSDQLGGGTPIGNAADVVAGAAFTCALGKDGAVFCWGDNRYGQLASGGDTVRVTPAAVPGLAHVGALAAGGAHNCATADDADGARALFCWGANDSGQLGNGSLADAPAVTRIPSLSVQPVEIAAGSAHTCAFAADKQLRCWGWGASGQLGVNPGFDMVVTTPTETDLFPPEGGDGVFAVAAGAAHTCVGAMISASVLCFGLDADGQLGDGRQAPGGPDPVASFYGKPKAMAAGDAHTCAIDGDGGIWCWGRNSEGQLGDGTTDERSLQTLVTLGQPADAITAGAAHTCALAGGRVFCWGRNAEGQLGTPLPEPRLSPLLVTGLAQARAVAAGGRHTCAIGDDATVSCWGANESGQLGDGDTMSTSVPTRVPGLTNVDGVVAGGAHTCAHRSDGSVWCWGANTSGQLGDRVTLTSPRPLLARIACQ